MKKRLLFKIRKRRRAMRELNLDNYERILPKRNQKFQFKVLESGKSLVGNAFLKKLQSNYVEISISEDAASIIINESANQDFRVCKSGYITNKEIAETVVHRGIILPAVYNMTWNEKHGLWNGEIAQYTDLERVMKRRRQTKDKQ